MAVRKLQGMARGAVRGAQMPSPKDEWLKRRMTKDIVLRARKVINNRLLNRKQLNLEVYHPEAAAPNLKELKQRISDKWSVPLDQVTLFHFRTQFGGGRSVGTCLLYDTKDLKMKIEPKHRLIRDGLVKKVVVPSRKAQKTLKTKLRKLHGRDVTKAKKGGK